MASFINVDTEDAFGEQIQAAKTRLIVMYFWASFHEACKEGGHMDTLFGHLSTLHGTEATFLKVNAEECSDVAETFGVSMVPSFVFVQDKKKVGIVEGAHPAEVNQKLEKFLVAASLAPPAASTPATTSSDSAAAMDLDKLTKSSRVMLFMKGNPEEPRCKFSREIVGILKDAGVKYGSFDILSNETVRADLKVYSNWPTYPQLYIDGKFVGGLDIVKEMLENDELDELLKPVADVEANKPKLEDRLKELINKAPVMLFMKGDPQEPQCGFSNKMVGILNEAGIKFDSFDILQDNDVRQGLKKYSDWPTYPQLYSGGNLIGGLDIVQEMAEDGDLASQIAEAGKC